MRAASIGTRRPHEKRPPASCEAARRVLRAKSHLPFRAFRFAAQLSGGLQTQKETDMTEVFEIEAAQLAFSFSTPKPMPVELLRDGRGLYGIGLPKAYLGDW